MLKNTFVLFDRHPVLIVVQSVCNHTKHQLFKTRPAICYRRSKYFLLHQRQRKIIKKCLFIFLSNTIKTPKSQKIFLSMSCNLGEKEGEQKFL